MEDLKYSDRRKYLQYPLNGNIYYFLSGGVFSSEIKAKILRVFLWENFLSILQIQEIKKRKVNINYWQKKMKLPFILKCRANFYDQFFFLRKIGRRTMHRYLLYLFFFVIILM